MAKIIGNTAATPNPRPDWLQNDSTKADYIKNKPDYDGLNNTVVSLEQQIASAMGASVKVVDNVLCITSDVLSSEIVGNVLSVESSNSRVSARVSGGVLVMSNGYIPQKGVDYWTDKDKQEVNDYIDLRLNDVDAALSHIISIQESLIGG